jgi:hypothetical protein
MAALSLADRMSRLGTESAGPGSRADGKQLVIAS